MSSESLLESWAEVGIWIWGQSASRWYLEKASKGAVNRAEEWEGVMGRDPAPGQGQEQRPAKLRTVWERGGRQTSELGVLGQEDGSPQTRVWMGPIKGPAVGGHGCPAQRYCWLAGGGCCLEGRLTPCLCLYGFWWDISASVMVMGSSDNLQRAQGLLLRGLLLRRPRACPGDGISPRRHHLAHWLEQKGVKPLWVVASKGRLAGAGMVVAVQTLPQGQHLGLGAGVHSNPGGAYSPQDCRRGCPCPGRKPHVRFVKPTLSLGLLRGLPLWPPQTWTPTQLVLLVFDGRQVAETAHTGGWVGEWNSSVGPGRGHLSGVGAVTVDPPSALGPALSLPSSAGPGPIPAGLLASCALDPSVSPAPRWPAAHTPLGSHAPSLALAVPLWQPSCLSSPFPTGPHLVQGTEAHGDFLLPACLQEQLEKDVRMTDHQLTRQLSD